MRDFIEMSLTFTLCTLYKKQFITFEEWTNDRSKHQEVEFLEGDTYEEALSRADNFNVSKMPYHLFLKSGKGASELQPEMKARAGATVGVWITKAHKLKQEEVSDSSAGVLRSGTKRSNVPDAVDQGTKMARGSSIPVADRNPVGHRDVGHQPMHSLSGNSSEWLQELVDEWKRRNLGHFEQEGMVGEHRCSGHVSWEFMQLAQKRARAVALVRRPHVDTNGVVTGLVENGTGTIFATGSALNRKYYLLTNKHVIPDADIAAAATFYLDYTAPIDEEEREGMGLDLNPDLFFACDKDLDYALIGIDPEVLPIELPGGGERTWLTFDDVRESPPAKFECVNVAGHPSGGPLAFSIRGLNYLCQRKRSYELSNIPEVILHGAYTQKGSSGSLLFGDDWRPFALHTGAGKAMLEDGREQAFCKTSSSGKCDFTSETDKNLKLYQHNVATPLSLVLEHAMQHGLVL
jgi:hypothetical protein